MALRTEVVSLPACRPAKMIKQLKQAQHQAFRNGALDPEAPNTDLHRTAASQTYFANCGGRCRQGAVLGVSGRRAISHGGAWIQKQERLHRFFLNSICKDLVIGKGSCMYRTHRHHIAYTYIVVA